MMGGGMMGGGMMGGAPKKKKTRSQADILAEQKAEEEREQRILNKKLAGNGDAAPEEKDQGSGCRGDRAFQGSDERSSVGCNHRGVRSCAARGELPGSAQEPGHGSSQLLRVSSLERQTKLADGNWSGWEAVSSKENLKILDNLPEVEDDELTPDNVRPEALVDPLPFLKSGLWEKVHVASLVPKEKKEIKKSEGAAAGGNMSGMEGMMQGMMSGMGQRGGGSGYGNQMKAASDMMAQMGGGRGGRRGGLGGGGGMAETAVTYWQSDAPKVMIRAFDFTVKPDNSYRYRARVVVFNPNLNRDDVSPGVDTKTQTASRPVERADRRGPHAAGRDAICHVG